VVISEQRERWRADGSPPVPTLVVDGVPHVLQRPSQAAELLGLESPPALRDAWQVAWDLDTIAEAWLEVAERTPWPALLEPVAGLRRTPLALTVDALVGVAALTQALDSAWFHWPGNPVTGELGDATVVAYEASIVAAIGTRDDLLAFAQPVAAGWRDAIVAHDEVLRREPDRAVGAPRGDLTLVELLEAQRLHAAQHYRQATAALAAEGHAVAALDLTMLYGLRLPDALS
jgi:hypothetical protein